MHRCKREFLQTQPTVEFDEVLIRPFMQPELLQSRPCQLPTVSAGTSIPELFRICLGKKLWDCKKLR